MDNESKKQLLDVTQKIILDADLGKLEGKKVDVSINIRNQKANLPQNIMVFQAFAYLAAIKLKPSTNRVLMYFFALSAYENYN